MTFDDILALFQEKSKGRAGFGGTLRLDMADEGSILIDGNEEQVEINASTAPADTTITLSLPTLQGLINGDLNPAMALMNGKLQVSGNMALAMKLHGVISGS